MNVAAAMSAGGNGAAGGNAAPPPNAAVQIVVDNGQMHINGQPRGQVNMGNLGAEIMSAINSAGRHAMNTVFGAAPQQQPSSNAQGQQSAPNQQPAGQQHNSISVDYNGVQMTQQLSPASPPGARGNDVSVYELRMGLDGLMRRMGLTVPTNAPQQPRGQTMGAQQMRPPQPGQQQNVTMSTGTIGPHGVANGVNNILMQHGQSQVQFVASPLVTDDATARQQMSSAMFVGARPPMDLPLYTLDPFLTCSSRHFDPIRMYHRRMLIENSVQAAAGEVTQREPQQQMETDEPPHAADGQAPPAEEETEFLRHLRSVVDNVMEHIEARIMMTDRQPNLRMSDMGTSELGTL